MCSFTEASISRPADPSCVLCASENVEPLQSTPGEYFHCLVCDLRYLHPRARLSPAEERVRYDLHNNDPNDSRYLDFLRPLLVALEAQVPAGASGLDFGCGPAPVLADMFRTRGFKVETYDPFFQPQPPAVDAQYDFISSSEAAEHFYDPLREFTRLHAWLKPGGWLGIMTAMVEPQIDFANWYYRRDPTHVVFYSRATFQWLAGHLGFAAPVFASDKIALLRRN